jgi:hypothetical protein
MVYPERNKRGLFVGKAWYMIPKLRRSDLLFISSQTDSQDHNQHQISREVLDTLP